jgi:hypothetical protein
MLAPETARLCAWRLLLEAAFRLFSKLGCLDASIRERFLRMGVNKASTGTARILTAASPK